MTGRNGSVNSVKRRSAYQFQCSIEINILFLNEINQTLKVKESSMTFVAVIELRLDAKLLQHQHAADAKHIFLFDAVFPVAAIEFVGDGTVKLTVHVEICVHEIQIHSSYAYLPYMAVDYTAGERYLQNHRLAVLVKHLSDGKLIEVLGLIVGNLLAVYRKSLGEIAIAVKETYSCHIDTAVRSFFDIVTGQNTKTT